MSTLSEGLRSILFPIVPKGLLKARKRYKWMHIRRDYASLTVSEAFSRIYREQLWGEAEGGKFFSGEGTTEPFAVPYVEAVSRFIREHGIKSVLDLGCGDFRVGNRISSATGVRYTGIDVVPDLIAYNNSHYGRDGVEFRCANIIEDELPVADLCLIRQVLQHLSNAEISRVLQNAARCPYLLVTEDLYIGRGSRPNLDHTHGPDNRLHKRSGVFLDLAPYNLKTAPVLEQQLPRTKSLLRTVLIRNEHAEMRRADAQRA